MSNEENKSNHKGPISKAGNWDRKGSRKLKLKMLKALKRNLSVVTYAAQEVGITQQTHYRWMRKDEDYKMAVESLKDVVLDFAERQLHKNVANGSDQALIFLLKCLGKKRGYIDRQVVEHKHEIPMNQAALEFFEMPDESTPKEIAQKEEVEDDFSFADFESMNLDDLDGDDLKEEIFDEAQVEYNSKKSTKKKILDRFKK